MEMEVAVGGLETPMLPTSRCPVTFGLCRPLWPHLSPRNTRNPSSSLALCSSRMETSSLGTPRGTFSPGGGASQIPRLQAGAEPKVCGWGGIWEV